MTLTIASSGAVAEVSAASFSGEIAALVAAFLWAAATLMFGRIGRQLAPVVLNLVKGAFAIAFILTTLLLRTNIPQLLSSLSLSDVVYLLLSGGIGIGLGDTAYFSAINSLGARRALLLEMLAPPTSAVLAWLFLDERLSLTAILGIGLTITGITWVISERTAESTAIKQTRGQIKAGLKVSLIAVLCQATGAVLSRGVLASTAIDPLFSALLRLLAGMAFLGLLVSLRPRLLGDYGDGGSDRLYRADESDRADTFDTPMPADIKRGWQTRWHTSLMALREVNLLLAVAIAAFFGTYLGIWLQQIALKYAQTGIAQALLATSPLFVLPMAATLGERISYRAILGALISLAGVWVLLAS